MLVSNNAMMIKRCSWVYKEPGKRMVSGQLPQRRQGFMGGNETAVLGKVKKAQRGNEICVMKIN